MILQGNQRGGAKNLALHLLKDENDHVEVHDLRGFVSDDLVSAFKEIHAVARGTRAKQFLFSCSFNPPPDEEVQTQAFEDAIERVEEKLSLGGQPRAIVFHSKNGRRHCHVVWSRIDAQEMKAIPLPFTKRKLMDVARDLYLEHGWKMPRGLMSPGKAAPWTYSLAQWQQAKRAGKDAKAIKQTFQDCWAASDSRQAFAQALKERGYVLAKGDRRGVVALDYRCEVFCVSKWSGVRAKDVRAKLGKPDDLPSVDEARKQIANGMAKHLSKLQKVLGKAIQARINGINAAQERMRAEHRAERKKLEAAHAKRKTEETRARQSRFQKGFRGLFDLLTGRHRQIKEQNLQETWLANQRDQREKDALVFRQLEQRRVLQSRINRLQDFHEQRDKALLRDIAQYEYVQMENPKCPSFDSPAAQSESARVQGIER